MARWVWDPAKAAANLAKHGVSFDLALRVFGDPFALSRPDVHPDGDRWQTIGMPSSASPVVLLVVHTETVETSDAEEVGRIISARLAERWERRAYEEGKF